MPDLTMEETLTRILDERDKIVIDGYHTMTVLQSLQFAIGHTPISIDSSDDPEKPVEDVLFDTYMNISNQADAIHHVARQMAYVQNRIQRARTRRP
jgi:hypothetical protein